MIDPRELLLTPDEPAGWISYTTWWRPESKASPRRLASPAVFRRIAETNRELYRTALRGWLRQLPDGLLRPDYIAWDFDSKSDLKIAFQDAYRLVQLLKGLGVPEVWITTFFSGSKGVAVLLAAAFFSPQAAGKEEWEAAAAFAAKRIHGGEKMSSADPSVWRAAQPLRWYNVVHLETDAYRILLSPDDLLRDPAEVVARAKQGPRDLPIGPDAPPPSPCPQLVEVFRDALELAKSTPAATAKARAPRRTVGAGTSVKFDDDLHETTRKFRAALPFATFVSPNSWRRPVLVIEEACPACLSEAGSRSGAVPGTAWITDRTHRLRCWRNKCRAGRGRAGEKGLRPDQWIPMLVPQAYGASGLELAHAAEVNGEWADSALKEPLGPLPSLRIARSTLRKKLRAAIRGVGPQVIVFEATPGLGKTVTTAREIQDAHERGALRDRRVLIALDTKEQIAELLARPDLDYLQGVAKVREGRNKHNCADKAAAGEKVSNHMGARRRNVRGYCSGSEFMCPHAQACAQSGYLQHVRDCDGASCVLTTKSTLSTNPKMLKQFDLIVVDEDLSSCLLDEFVVTSDVVKDWRTALARTPSRGAVYPEVERWLTLLDRVLARHLPRKGGDGGSFLTVLIDEAAVMQVDLAALLVAIAEDIKWSDSRPAWEKSSEDGGEKTIPLRATADLLRLLAAELGIALECKTRRRRLTLVRGTADSLSTGTSEVDRPEWAGRPVLEDAAVAVAGKGTNTATGTAKSGASPAGQDSSFRLTSEGIVVHVLRDRLAKVLRGKRVINLDGTPCTPVLRRVFPRLRHEVVQAQEHVRVVQITNALCQKVTVAGELPQFRELLEARTAREALPTIFTWKDFNPDANEQSSKVLKVSNPNARYGHFGAHLRGMNKYENSSLVVIVGHLLSNIGIESARFRALRLQTGGVAGPVGHVDRLAPYTYRGPNGERFARGVKGDADPELDAHTDWLWYSSVRQGVARGRPALRTAGTPLDVLLLCAKPVTGLPVHELTTIPELRQKLGLGTVAPSVPPCLPAANAAKQEEFDARVERALIEYMATEPFPWDRIESVLLKRLEMGDSGHAYKTLRSSLERIERAWWDRRRADRRRNPRAS